MSPRASPGKLGKKNFIHSGNQTPDHPTYSIMSTLTLLLWLQYKQFTFERSNDQSQPLPLKCWHRNMQCYDMQSPEPKS